MSFYKVEDLHDTHHEREIWQDTSYQQDTSYGRFEVCVRAGRDLPNPVVR